MVYDMAPDPAWGLDDASLVVLQVVAAAGFKYVEQCELVFCLIFV